MPKLRESILADIHTKNIHPRPRWQYILLHTGLWSTGIVTIVLGSFACAHMMLEFSLPERAYLRWIETQENIGWLLALPYLWGIGMILALTVTYFIFSKTDRGYRFHAGTVAGILIFGSLLGGGMIYVTGAAHFSDRQIQRFEPRYRDLRQGFLGMLPRPEDGTLPLRVLSIEGDIIHGQSPDGQTWQVILTCSDDDCEEKKGKIGVGKPVIFEGEISKIGYFSASELFFPQKGMPRIYKKKLPMIQSESDHGSEEKGE